MGVVIKNRKKHIQKEQKIKKSLHFTQNVSVCLCVCEWEREREFKSFTLLFAELNFITYTILGISEIFLISAVFINAFYSFHRSWITNTLDNETADNKGLLNMYAEAW